MPLLFLEIVSHRHRHRGPPPHHRSSCQRWYHQPLLISGVDHFLFFLILGIIIPTD